MQDLFICPKCGTSFERDNHYKKIIDCQNFINMFGDNNEIIDMCGKCNHFVYNEDKKTNKIRINIRKK